MRRFEHSLGSCGVARARLVILLVHHDERVEDLLACTRGDAQHVVLVGLLLGQLLFNQSVGIIGSWQQCVALESEIIWLRVALYQKRHEVSLPLFR